MGKNSQGDTYSIQKNVLHKDHQSLSQVESMELRVYSFNEMKFKFTLNAILSFFFLCREKKCGFHCSGYEIRYKMCGFSIF